MIERLYHYRAELVRIIDGDTVRLRVDLGFKQWREDNYRLNGIDTPEVRGIERPEGLAATEALRLLIEGQPLIVETHKPDKYGRWLVTIYADGECVNDVLVRDGFAVSYNGGVR